MFTWHPYMCHSVTHFWDSLPFQAIFATNTLFLAASDILPVHLAALPFSQVCYFCYFNYASSRVLYLCSSKISWSIFCFLWAKHILSVLFHPPTFPVFSWGARTACKSTKETRLLVANTLCEKKKKTNNRGIYIVYVCVCVCVSKGNLQPTIKHRKILDSNNSNYKILPLVLGGTYFPFTHLASIQGMLLLLLFLSCHCNIFPFLWCFPEGGATWDFSRGISNGRGGHWVTWPCTAAPGVSKELNEPYSAKDQWASLTSSEWVLWLRPKLWHILSPQIGTYPITSELFQWVVRLLLADTLPH